MKKTGRYCNGLELRNHKKGGEMPDLKEKLEDLTKQYKEVAEQAMQSATMKTKLEGAIEMTQMLMKEEEEAAKAEKDTKKGKKGE